MAFKLGMVVDLYMTHVYAHAQYFDDLDLDARSQWWLGKGKIIRIELSRTLSKQ